MMNKPRTTRVQAARYLLLLPLAAGLALWSCEKKAYLPEPVATNQNQAASSAENALYFVDGVPSTREALNQISPSAIQSVNVVKGRKFMPGFNEEAFKQDFGAIGEKGVMLILTKAGQNSEAVRAFNTKYNIVYKEAVPEDKAFTVRVKENAEGDKDISLTDFKDRLVFINGQEANGQTTTLKGGDIQSVYVLDAEKATAKYGEKGKKGAVLITTK